MQGKNIFIKAIRLFFLLLLTNSIGYLAGAYMTPDTVAWYHQLPMSNLTPPDFVFGIVWTILFLLMSIAAFLVWNKVSPRWFVLQLMANMIWSFSFFYLKSPQMALFVLLLMLFFIYKTIIAFYKVSKISGLLMCSTLIWSVFALYLNCFIVFM